MKGGLLDLRNVQSEDKSEDFVVLSEAQRCFKGMGMLGMDSPRKS